ncbi:MAG TPA: MFS transporter [Candidatus Limnocylindria bacterium]
MAELTERDPAVVAAPTLGVLAAPRRTRFAALEVPTFRWYWIVSWISQTGDGMENVIRGYLVVQLVGLAGAPFWLGMMVFAHWVPFTVFALYGGVLADRYDPRKVQIVAQLLLLTAALGVAIATLSNIVTVWWIFGLLLVHGFAGAIGNPAQQTLIHSIVGRERLLSAVSLNSTMRQFSQVIGPAVAGFVFLAFGAGWGFLVNAMTFIPLLVFLSLVHIKRLHEGERRPAMDALREGLGYVRQRPLLGSLIGIEAVTVIFLGHTFNSLLVVFAVDRFPTIPLAYPFLLVASGVGAIVAAVYLGSARERKRPALFIALTAMVEMLAILLFAFSGEYAVSLALMLVVGAAGVITASLTNTTLQLSAPDRIRGRVMGAYTFGTQGLRVVNGPLLGALAIAFGVPLAVAGSAGLVLVVLGGVVLAVPQLRAAGPA